MASRIVLCFGLFLALLGAGATRAGEPGGKTAPRAALSDSAAVERRITALEARISELLKEVRSLRAELTGSLPSDQTRDVRVFALRFADAAALATMLKGLLADGDADPRIFADPRTNCVVVRGSREQVESVAQLLAELDQPGK